MAEVQELPRSLMHRSQRRIEEAEREVEELMQAELEAKGNAPDPEPSNEQPAPGKVETLSPEEETYKKRYSDLRRHQQKTEKELKDRIDALEQQLTEKPSGAMPKSEEEVAAWVERYPDVAAIVESLADKKAKERDTNLDVRLSQIEQMQLEVEQEKAKSAILKLHPDFEEISQNDEFHDWVETQPKWVQDSVYDTFDASTVARALDLYKLDKGIKKTTPDKNAALAINTRTRVTPQEDEKSDWFSESQIQKMSDKEFTEKLPEIEKAQREGRFKYDLTKKGR